MLDWPFTLGWAIIVLCGLTLEIIALVRPGKGDTASEHVWWVLRRHPIVWFCSLGLFAWVILHFFGPTWVSP